nr:hypothetical protein L203_03183 [Cryptococcus depauperatus CBS 7841]
MTATTKLINLLPALMLFGLALTGVENAPAALANQSGKDHHRQLVARLAGNIEEHERRRLSVDGRVLRRRADGSVCRAKNQASSSVNAQPVTPTPDAGGQNAVVQSPSPTDVSVTDSWSTSSSASSQVTTTEVAAVAVPNKAVTGALGSGGWVNTGSKLGAAWPNGNWAENGSPDFIGNYIGIKTSWYYTWSSFSVGSGDSLGLEYVPMLWGPKQVSDWWAQMPNWPKTVKNALFFNEPNQSGQSDMSPGDAVSHWMNDFLPVRSKGVRLGGAATTSAPSGLQWIKDFGKACTDYGNSAADCTPDFIPVHWYDVTIENFQQYVTNFHTETGANLWVTEYACQNFNGGAQCSDQESWNLHTVMAAWFDQQNYIERYSPFGVMKDMQGVNQNNALMNPDGSITSLGGWYITSA